MMEPREERQRKKRAKHGLLWLAFVEVTYLSDTPHAKKCYGREKSYRSKSNMRERVSKENLIARSAAARVERRRGCSSGWVEGRVSGGEDELYSRGTGLTAGG